MQTELSNKTMAIIEDSAVLVTAKAYEISEYMYKILFEKYPEIKVLFQNAPQNQSSLVAEALSAYAVNIKKIHIFLPALEVIANTHVSVNIQKYHYTTLGIIFIQALEYILKKSATLEFLDAWREAYKYISNTLIRLEEEIYTKGMR